MEWKTSLRFSSCQQESLIIGEHITIWAELQKLDVFHNLDIRTIDKASSVVKFT